MPDILTSVIVIDEPQTARIARRHCRTGGVSERWQGTVIGGTKIPRQSCLVKRRSRYLGTPPDGMPSDRCNTLHSRSFHGLKCFEGK
jgi:hypothetical protein